MAGLERPTSSSSGAARSAAGPRPSSPRRVSSGSSSSNAGWSGGVPAVAPRGSSGRRAARRPRSLSVAGRSTSIAASRVRYGTDSGFRELGYLIIAVTARDEREGRARVAMQQAEGLPVGWLAAFDRLSGDPELAQEARDEGPVRNLVTQGRMGADAGAGADRLTILRNGRR